MIASEKMEPAEGYDPAFFDLLVQVEDDHFWFRSRNDLILSLAGRLMAGVEGDVRLLEVGCGTGNVLRKMERINARGLVAGMDLFAEGLLHARQRTSASLVQADMHRPPFRESFYLIGMFDVLEHMPHDLQALKDLFGILQPGGYLLLTVPAHRQLWSYFDEASHHCRRYELVDLKRKLGTAGFSVTFATQYMMSIFPLVWLGRRLSRLRTRFSSHHETGSYRRLATQELRPLPVLNGLLGSLLKLENRWLLRGHSLPLGTSLLAIARKPETVQADIVMPAVRATR